MVQSTIAGGRARAEYFKLHVANLAIGDGAKAVEPAPVLGREALESAQWAGQSSTAAALQQMGARFAGGEGALGALVRNSQDLTSFWRERNKALIEALAKPDGQRNAALIEAIRRQIAEAESKIAAINARLKRSFPTTQRSRRRGRLRSTTCNSSLVPTRRWCSGLGRRRRAMSFALTRERFEWQTIPLGAEDLAKKVAAFRRGLDVERARRRSRPATRAGPLRSRCCARALQRPCSARSKR